MSTSKEDVFRFRMETKHITVESLFVALCKDVQELDKYTNYSISEMFGYGGFEGHHYVEKLDDMFWEDDVTSFIQPCNASKQQIEFVREWGVGPNVVEYIHDYGEISNEDSDASSM